MVIAIIAVLAGMLFPALGSAKERALAIRCINQQKQIYYPLIAYSDDNNGYSVPVNGESLTSNTWALMLWLKGYMRGGQNFRDGYRKENLVCPSMADTGESGAYYGMFRWKNDMGVTYPIFAHDTGVGNGWCPIYKRIVRPGEQGLTADCWQNAKKRQWCELPLDYDKAGLPLPETSYSGVATPHAKQANMLMLAGNVRQWDVQQLADSKKSWNQGPFVNIPYYIGISYR